MLETYQEARIRSYFTASGDANYMTSMLRKFNENILLWGNSGKDVVGGLPEFNQDYIFLYSEQLRIAGRNLCSRAPGITGSVSVRSVGQTENELGMVMGFGCGMIIY